MIVVFPPDPYERVCQSWQTQVSCVCTTNHPSFQFLLVFKLHQPTRCSRRHRSSGYLGSLPGDGLLNLSNSSHYQAQRE